MKKTKKALASLAIASMTLTALPFNALAANTDATRLAGETAVQTSQAISQNGWETSSLNAVIAPATAYNMVDALAAAPLAATLNAPVLLTGGDQLSPEVKSEITRLGVKTVFVTSGLAVIKAGVIADLQGMGVTVVNLGGFDQYETSVNIAKEIAKVNPTTSIYIANGETARVAQDALSVASIAGAQKQPLILSQKAALPKVVVDYLDTIDSNVTTSYITGGTGVISEEVKAQLPGTVYRNSGFDAYDTNLEVLKNFSTLDFNRIFVANGETMIDALSGAPLAAQANSPVVLVNQTVKPATTEFLKTKVTAATVVTALGGLAVVPEKLRLAIENPGQLNITNVAGTTGTIYNNKADQQLKLSTDGVGKTVAELKAAGYSVEFQATENVFVGGEATSSDGLVSANLEGNFDSFTYVVVISKGDKVVATSSSKRVNVVEKNEGSALIDEVNIYLGESAADDVKVISGKIAKQDEDVYFKVKGTDSEEDDIKDTTEFATFESSNAAIATVENGTGLVKLNGGLGAVTITIHTSNGATTTKSFTVVDGERAVSKANTNLTTSSVKIGNSVVKEIGITVKDQYGDPIKDYLVDFKTDDANDATIENESGQEMATADAVETSKDGEATITITALDANTGTGTLKIIGDVEASEDNVDLGTVSVSVAGTTNTLASKYELNTVLWQPDKVIDSNSTEGDDVTELYFTTYNSSGYEIENVQDGTDKMGNEYTLKLDGTNADSDPSDNVSAEWNEDKIVVTAKKAGSVKLSVYEGTIQRATATIKVEDTRAVISSVSWQSNIPDIESTDGYSLDDFLLTSGIKTDSGKSVFFTEAVTDEFDIKTANGTVVGRVKLSVASGSLSAEFDEERNIIVSTEDSFASGKLLLAVYKVGGMDDDQVTLVSSKTINVKEIGNN